MLPPLIKFKAHPSRTSAENNQLPVEETIDWCVTKAVFSSVVIEGRPGRDVGFECLPTRNTTRCPWNKSKVHPLLAV